MNAIHFLQNKSRAITNWDLDSVVAFAAAQGFTFTATELQTAIDDMWGVLSEEELANAAGGKNDKGNKGNGNGNGGDPGASSCSFYYNN